MFGRCFGRSRSRVFHFFGRPQGPLYEKSTFRTPVKRGLLAILQASFCDFNRTDYAEKREENRAEAARRGANPVDFALVSASARGRVTFFGAFLVMFLTKPHQNAPIQCGTRSKRSSDCLRLEKRPQNPEKDPLPYPCSLVNEAQNG